MKKKINLAFLSVLFLSSWLRPGTIVNAASNVQVTESILTFSQLGRRDMIMRGPFDSASIDFSLPAEWELQDGTELQLLISASFTGESGTKSIQVNDYIGAGLDIYFNGAYQQSIPLKYGENIAYQIPISAADLVSRSIDGIYSIYFELDASIDCDFSPRTTTIVISSSSYISLPYVEGLLNLDLRRLPWPIYQPGKQSPNSTFVVLPNSPSPDEMQAALLTMAAFGRMTNSELSMSVISLSGLNNTFRDQAHL
ncbi:MAG: cellulose biosynthesis cyclic di-GMP-binding regulatory protein BcsB, partial [Bacteroidia bacterium]|nr:cellulose biosynthesis cyclic di-GMP-binding regulatory protein BcsB [Bacteroidia bacterium]